MGRGSDGLDLVEMGLDNPLHIAFLVVILLLVFGARRLPEIGRSLGSGMREFKTSVTGELNQSQQSQSTLATGTPQQQQPVQTQDQQAQTPPAPAQQATPGEAVAVPVDQPPASWGSVLHVAWGSVFHGTRQRGKLPTFGLPPNWSPSGPAAGERR